MQYGFSTAYMLTQSLYLLHRVAAADIHIAKTISFSTRELRHVFEDRNEQPTRSSFSLSLFAKTSTYANDQHETA